MKDTGKGFDAWYSGGLHITSPDTDLHTQTVEAHLPHEIPDPVTRKHLFGKDHWFMGAKYPNQDTISPETRAMYFTKGQQK